jgi:hypothetical protein
MMMEAFCAVDMIENFAGGFHQSRDGEAKIRPRLKYLVKIGSVGIVKDARAIESRPWLRFCNSAQH